jgi:hypothetical protein
MAATTPCIISSCPLNEAGIHHPVGVYKHHGKESPTTPSFEYYVFGASNPPPFIKDANTSFWQIKTSGTKDKEKELAQLGGTVGRYADLHSGRCDGGCRENGKGFAMAGETRAAAVGFLIVVAVVAAAVWAASKM